MSVSILKQQIPTYSLARVWRVPGGSKQIQINILLSYTPYTFRAINILFSYTPYIFRAIKSSGMAGMGRGMWLTEGRTNGLRFLVGNPERKRWLERTRCRWKGNRDNDFKQSGRLLTWFICIRKASDCWCEPGNDDLASKNCWEFKFCKSVHHHKNSNKLTNQMQRLLQFITWRLFTAEHFSGVLTPIIRSSTTAVAASPFTFGTWW